MELYPLLMEPNCVPESETPWGGTMLKDAMLKETKQEILGAEYEFSAKAQSETLVASGPLAGKGLGRIIDAQDGAADLYVKLLDVQTEFVQKIGNTRLLIVLGVEEGAGLTIGEKTFAPRPGDAFLAAAGEEVALKGSIQLYEAGTFTDGEGGYSGKLAGTTALYKGGSRTYYVCGYGLEACRLNVSGQMPLETDRFSAITMLGMGKIAWDGGEIEPMPFSTLVLPPHLPGLTISGKLKAVLVSAPDQAALKAEMGYRAADIPGLAD